MFLGCSRGTVGIFNNKPGKLPDLVAESIVFSLSSLMIYLLWDFSCILVASFAGCCPSCQAFLCAFFGIQLVRNALAMWRGQSSAVFIVGYLLYTLSEGSRMVCSVFCEWF